MAFSRAVMQWQGRPGSPSAPPRQTTPEGQKDMENVTVDQSDPRG